MAALQHFRAVTWYSSQGVRYQGVAFTTQHTGCTKVKHQDFLGDLLRNTKLNAETAEAAEKRTPVKLCDLCVLCVQTS